MRSLGVSRSVLVLAVAVPWLAGGAAIAIALLGGRGTLATAGLFVAAFGAVAAAELFAFALGQPRVPRIRRRVVVSVGGALRSRT